MVPRNSAGREVKLRLRRTKLLAKSLGRQYLYHPPITRLTQSAAVARCIAATFRSSTIHSKHSQQGWKSRSPDTQKTRVLYTYISIRI